MNGQSCGGRHRLHLAAARSRASSARPAARPRRSPPRPGAAAGARPRSASSSPRPTSRRRRRPRHSSRPTPNVRPLGSNITISAPARVMAMPDARRQRIRSPSISDGQHRRDRHAELAHHAERRGRGGLQPDEDEGEVAAADQHAHDGQAPQRAGASAAARATVTSATSAKPRRRIEQRRRARPAITSFETTVLAAHTRQTRVIRPRSRRLTASPGPAGTPLIASRPAPEPHQVLSL